MNRYYILAVLTAGFAVWIAFPVQAGGFYVSSDLGRNFGESLDIDGRDDDRPSVCDEYINPDYALLTGTDGEPNCTAPRTGDAIQGNFSSDEGVLLGIALGQRVRESRFRIELEYFYRDTGYDEAYHTPVGVGGTYDKSRNELQTAMQRIDSLTSHNLFANLYLDFAQNSRFVPYIGFGIGFGFTDLEYAALWARNVDPCAIRTGSDPASCPAISDGVPTGIQRNLAGTTTTESEKLEDTLFGYQVLAGVDYALTESLMLGVKGRWVHYDSFRDRDMWDQLRSHAPNLRRDGSEPVTYHLAVDDIEMFGISLNLKYQF
ncbi:MAG: outer membrane beta-barrel protein [Gammaproteobacteria bacterium]|nr:outer membrane beta-barrel protein [Gammaproteobacteria bacterium]